MNENDFLHIVSLDGRALVKKYPRLLMRYDMWSTYYNLRFRKVRQNLKIPTLFDLAIKIRVEVPIMDLTIYFDYRGFLSYLPNHKLSLTYLFRDK